MMKNMKRHTKSVISIVLALVLIVSTVAVGIIATNAAYLNGKPKSAEAANAEADVADANAVGAKADDTASVGAKAPEAVGAKADSESVGGSGRYLFIGYNDDQLTYQGELPINTVTVNANETVFINVTRNSSSWYKDYEWYDGNDHKPKYDISGAYGITINGTQNRSKTEGNTTYHPYYISAKFTTTGTYNFSYNDNTDTLTITGGATPYTISYGSTTNGSFTTKPTSANSGSTVTVVATPNTGYQVSSVTYTPDGGSATDCTHGSGNNYTFTMPSKNVTVNADFTKASYDITAIPTYCTVDGFTSPAEYGSTVNFTVTPQTGYALKTLTVKQGTTTINYTDNGSGSYSFTMPAGAVTITATCATTSGTVDVYFKSATAWVYHPFITVNDGAEREMTVDSYLDNGPKDTVVKPKSDTGSLRYAWYKVSLTGVDTSKPVTIKIRGKDTYMEAEGTFNIGAGSQVYLACDNLMEGSTLVDLSSQTPAVKDFYDTPLHMVATAAEIAEING